MNSREFRVISEHGAASVYRSSGSAIKRQRCSIYAKHYLLSICLKIQSMCRLNPGMHLENILSSDFRKIESQSFFSVDPCERGNELLCFGIEVYGWISTWRVTVGLHHCGYLPKCIPSGGAWLCTIAFREQKKGFFGRCEPCPLVLEMLFTPQTIAGSQLNAQRWPKLFIVQTWCNTMHLEDFLAWNLTFISCFWKSHEYGC